MAEQSASARASTGRPRRSARICIHGPDAAPPPITRTREVSRPSSVEPVDHVPHRVAGAFEDGAGEMRLAVAGGGADEAGARRGDPARRHRAGERGDEQEARRTRAAPRRRGARRRRRRGTEKVSRNQLTAPPDSQPGLPTLKWPVGKAWVSTRRCRVEDRAVGERRDRLAGAEGDGDRAGRGDPRAERVGEIVAGADRDRNARSEAR